MLRGGITSYCTDPDAAWSFLRTLLLPEFQDAIENSLPVRRDSLQKLVQAAQLMQNRVQTYLAEQG